MDVDVQDNDDNLSDVGTENDECSMDSFLIASELARAKKERRRMRRKLRREQKRWERRSLRQAKEAEELTDASTPASNDAAATCGVRESQSEISDAYRYHKQRDMTSAGREGNRSRRHGKASVSTVGEYEESAEGEASFNDNNGHFLDKDINGKSCDEARRKSDFGRKLRAYKHYSPFDLKFDDGLPCLEDKESETELANAMDVTYLVDPGTQNNPEFVAFQYVLVQDLYSAESGVISEEDEKHPERCQGG